MNKAIFLDRDGTLIPSHEDRPISDVKDFYLFDGVVDGLKKMKDLGYLLIVVTNQSGVADGRWTLEQCQTINHEICRCLNGSGILLDSIFMCTHHKEGNCECRKPKPGMLYQARDKYNINLERSYMIGNEIKDVLAGKNAGCKTILLKDRNKYIPSFEVTPDYYVDNLIEASSYIRKLK